MSLLQPCEISSVIVEKALISVRNTTTGGLFFVFFYFLMLFYFFGLLILSLIYSCHLSITTHLILACQRMPACVHTSVASGLLNLI